MNPNQKINEVVVAISKSFTSHYHYIISRKPVKELTDTELQDLAKLDHIIVRIKSGEVVTVDDVKKYDLSRE